MGPEAASLPTDASDVLPPDARVSRERVVAPFHCAASRAGFQGQACAGSQGQPVSALLQLTQTCCEQLRRPPRLRLGLKKACGWLTARRPHRQRQGS